MFCFLLNRVIKVQSYGQLVSYLANGADIRYFFNASACMTRTRTASYDEDETPVVGGALNFFSASKDPDSAHIIFSQVRYSDEKPSGKILTPITSLLINTN